MCQEVRLLSALRRTDDANWPRSPRAFWEAATLSPTDAGSLSGKAMFFVSSCVGRLGQAAVKPLYARQHARSRNTQLTPALTASLWTFHHLAHVALPRSIPLTSHPTKVPLVYADAFFAAGDRQYEVSDVVENKVAFTSAGITKLVNGFGVFMFPVHGQPLFFHGMVPAEVLAEFCVAWGVHFPLGSAGTNPGFVGIPQRITRPLLCVR